MKLKIFLTALTALAFGMVALPSQAGESEDQAALVQALPGAKVSLRQGLEAAAARGRPISGKFEIEDGKLQLSVYTSKSGKFSEVIVDYNKGTVAKAEAITEGDDLAAAKAQSAALAKVKSTLAMAVANAEHDAAGYRAIRVVPENGDQGAVAKVTLIKGSEVKTVALPLK
ncbi:hypothetical protein [Cupriavidus metallidurans]|jgi:hypothetical protein|uniref:hypothetical protein n=1 Tax=Cupriavidus metallidurans TaxID=119219 RepID=UPI000CE051AD|nr:hypothetical protein [Cupriavidus metallidurans]AVA38234.1 hypothetical protein C3Z06_32020 [Cupriavidus metallidurans]